MLVDILRRAVGQARCRAFDWRHGVRTCGAVTLDGLTIAGGNVGQGGFYLGSHPRFIFRVIKGLKIDYRRYVFIDLGSGKGRVLLVASEFPFMEVLGVEFARELHEIACENIRRYRSSTQKCKRMRCLHADAVAFEFPPVPIVVFMANPFGPGVLVPVLHNLQRSLDSHPRDILLVYEAPFHGHNVENETTLRCVEKSIYHNTYRALSSQ